MTEIGPGADAEAILKVLTAYQDAIGAKLVDTWHSQSGPLLEALEDIAEAERALARMQAAQQAVVTPEGIEAVARGIHDDRCMEPLWRPWADLPAYYQDRARQKAVVILTAALEPRP